ncbi:hypothetical protein [Nocardia farcinica]
MREFHFIITLSFNSYAGGGNNFYTCEGVYNATDTRRDQLYNGVIDHAKKQFGLAPAQPYSVLFYSLEPLHTNPPRTPETDRVTELEAELNRTGEALDYIARRVRPDIDGTWCDQDGILESVGNAVEKTGRKVWVD